MKSHRVGTLPIGVVTALLCLGAAQAPQFAATVNVLRLEVVVNTADGHFVPDLDVADFEVFVAGARSRVLAAIEVDHGMPRGEPAEEIADSPAEFAATPLAEATALSQSRNFLALVDLAHMDARSLRYSRAAAREFFAKVVMPQDRVAVAIYSPRRGLELAVPFTTNHDIAEAWLEGFGTDRATESVESAGDGIDLAAFRDIGGQEDTARFVEELDAIRVAMAAYDFLLALQDMTRALSAVAGSKHVLFFSRGLPDQMLLNTDFRDEAIDVVDAARLQGVVIHSFNPTVTPLSDVHDLADIGSKLRTDQADLNRGRPMEGTVLPTGVEDRGVLNMLAHETGGTTTYFRHNLSKGLAAMETASRRHYVLAVAMPGNTDSAKGRVEVAVRDGHQLRVSWVRSHIGAPAEASASLHGSLLRTAEAIEFGNEVDEFSAAVLVDAVSMVDHIGKLAVAIEISAQELHRLSILADGDALEFEVLGLVVNSRRLVEDHFRGRISLASSLELSRDDSPPLRYTNLLSSSIGEHYVKILLRESATGALTTRGFRFVVPASPASALRVAAFAVVEPDAPVVAGNVRSERPVGVRSDSLRGPFMFDGRSVAPSLSPEFLPGQQVTLVATIFNVVAHPFTGQPNLSVAAEVQGSDGAVSLLEVRRVTVETGPEPGSVRVLVTALVPPRWPRTGAVTLSVTDRISGVSARAARNYPLAPRQ